jgi:hypothetical protein
MTPRNPEAVQRLAALVRELAAREDYRHLMHYAHLIASLQSLLDELKLADKTTTNYGTVREAAVKMFKASRKYSTDHFLEAPNIVMQKCGYDWFSSGL